MSTTNKFILCVRAEMTTEAKARDKSITIDPIFIFISLLFLFFSFWSRKCLAMSFHHFRNSIDVDERPTLNVVLRCHRFLLMLVCGRAQNKRIFAFISMTQKHNFRAPSLNFQLDVDFGCGRRFSVCFHFFFLSRVDILFVEIFSFVCLLVAPLAHRNSTKM